ncbi:hypothetical protein BJF78_31725 [Pseudonocardia sp. CNS-139]|nr:hypothetical protein BJF78_31725 [Pseudonocardia sp. CNS-139]
MIRRWSAIACRAAAASPAAGVDDAPVLGADRRRTLARAGLLAPEERGHADPHLPGPQAGVRAGDQLVAGRVDERLVETPVPLDELAGRRDVRHPGREQPLLLRERRPHVRERHRPGGQRDRRGVLFEQRAQLHQVADLVARERRHVRPAFGHHLDEAVRGEQQQRLAHRRA